MALTGYRVSAAEVFRLDRRACTRQRTDADGAGLARRRVQARCRPHGPRCVSGGLRVVRYGGMGHLAQDPAKDASPLGAPTGFRVVRCAPAPFRRMFAPWLHCCVVDWHAGAGTQFGDDTARAIRMRAQGPFHVRCWTWPHPGPPWAAVSLSAPMSSGVDGPVPRRTCSGAAVPGRRWAAPGSRATTWPSPRHRSSGRLAPEARIVRDWPCTRSCWDYRPAAGALRARGPRCALTCACLLLRAGFGQPAPGAPPALFPVQAWAAVASRWGRAGGGPGGLSSCLDDRHVPPSRWPWPRWPGAAGVGAHRLGMLASGRPLSNQAMTTWCREVPVFHQYCHHGRHLQQQRLVHAGGLFCRRLRAVRQCVPARARAPPPASPAPRARRAARASGVPCGAIIPWPCVRARGRRVAVALRSLRLQLSSPCGFPMRHCAHRPALASQPPAASCGSVARRSPVCAPGHLPCECIGHRVALCPQVWFVPAGVLAAAWPRFPAPHPGPGPPVRSDLGARAALAVRFGGVCGLRLVAGRCSGGRAACAAPGRGFSRSVLWRMPWRGRRCRLAAAFGSPGDLIGTSASGHWIARSVIDMALCAGLAPSSLAPPPPPPSRAARPRPRFPPLLLRRARLRPLSLCRPPPPPPPPPPRRPFLATGVRLAAVCISIASTLSARMPHRTSTCHSASSSSPWLSPLPPSRAGVLGIPLLPPCAPMPALPCPGPVESARRRRLGRGSTLFIRVVAFPCPCHLAVHASTPPAAADFLAGWPVVSASRIFSSLLQRPPGGGRRVAAPVRPGGPRRFLRSLVRLKYRAAGCSFARERDWRRWRGCLPRAPDPLSIPTRWGVRGPSPPPWPAPRWWWCPARLPLAVPALSPGPSQWLHLASRTSVGTP